MGGPSLGNFLMFLGCLFQDRFLIVLRSILESIWGPFWHYNRTQIEEKTGLILRSILGASLGANEKNETLFPSRGDPWGTPHIICASTRKNEKARFQQLFLSLFKKKAQLFLSLFRLLLTFAYHCSDYC